MKTSVAGGLRQMSVPGAAVMVKVFVAGAGDVMVCRLATTGSVDLGNKRGAAGHDTGRASQPFIYTNPAS